MIENLLHFLFFQKLRNFQKTGLDYLDEKMQLATKVLHNLQQ